jgi:hypothetical protein
MSISSVNGIPMRIAPLGDPKVEIFSLLEWEQRRKSPRNRFGDGDGISSSFPRKLRLRKLY